MVFVITGDGKGKTTSSMGMLIRALGNGLKCSVFQFIKKDCANTGEYHVFNNLGVDWKSFGEGFTWAQESLEPTRVKCLEGWNEFTEKTQSKIYQMMILDEFTYVLENAFLDKNTVLDFLKKNYKGKDDVHVVITGRRACKELVDLADTVSEIQEVKHHFNTNGNKAVKGIEF